MKKEPSSYKRPFWCRFNWGHKWFKGNFIAPVYGRYERHCILCGKKEFSMASLGKKKTVWVHFDDDHPQGFDL